MKEDKESKLEQLEKRQQDLNRKLEKMKNIINQNKDKSTKVK